MNFNYCERFHLSSLLISLDYNSEESEGSGDAVETRVPTGPVDEVALTRRMIMSYVSALPM